MAECETNIWYDSQNIAEFKKNVSQGDRLEFSRYCYRHLGIYIGTYKSSDHQVIHFGMRRGAAKYSSAKSFNVQHSSRNEPEILLESIEETLDKDMVRINNSRDNSGEGWKPLSPPDIVKRAVIAYENKDDKTTAPYHLFKNNCEHFVNWCRYGKTYSDQVHHCKENAMVIGLAIFTILLACVFFCLKYYVGYWHFF